ncbi:DUF7832 domain-containing protein [Luteolibacter soli]|uniref:DUF7832 domain-containing protein n=1 Tax=Luteolibacter soli TaxID=3135280 RepID=A0ABU9ANA7_9BACT
MKYDDMSWHSGGDFPADLPPEAGATHTGMFVAWCLLNGLGGELHTEEFPDTLEKLRERKLTPGGFLIEACDGKFTDEDLGSEGNAFTEAYFDFSTGEYLADYEGCLGAPGGSLYAVPDTWDNFDKLAPVISNRFESWKKHGSA